jgi:ribosomal protein L7/L12
VLISNQGELTLTNSYSGGDRAPYEATADRIRTLMGLTPSSSDRSPDRLPENVLAAMDQGRKLEAIRLVRLHKGLSLSEAKRFVEQWSHTSRPADG